MITGFCVSGSSAWVRRPAAWILGLLLAAAWCAWTRRYPPSRLMLPADPARAAPSVRSRMRIGLNSLGARPIWRLRASATAAVVDGETGRPLGAVRPGTLLKLLAGSGGTIRLEGLGKPASARRVRLKGGAVRLGERLYPGWLEAIAGTSGIAWVNDLHVEEYLEGVLPGELPRSFLLEAQKAQAVAARSYALAQQGKHGDFDLCDRVCCQVYLGRIPEAVRARRAVALTRGLALWYGPRPACAFFSADCGGISTEARNVPLPDLPEGPTPYLQVRRDGTPEEGLFCGAGPYHTWTKRLTLEQLTTRLNRRPETAVGSLLSLEVAATDASGRATTIRLRGRAARGSGEIPEERVIEVSGWEFRRSVGGRTLKSTLFEIDMPQPGVARFRGRGFGHGLGLCQIGANGMARRGRAFRQILAHYYPGAAVRPLEADAGELESLPGPN